MRRPIVLATLLSAPVAAPGCVIITDKELRERLGLQPDTGETASRETGQPDTSEHSAETGDSDTDTDTDTDTAPADCDVDDDGHDAAGCGGDDCDDSDPAILPGATESCDNVDSDCDGLDGTQNVLYFGDASDYVRVLSSGTGMDLGDDWTVEAWVFPTSSDLSGVSAIFGKVGVVSEKKLFQLEGGVPVVVATSTLDGTTELIGGSALSPGAWSHVAWVADSGTMAIYVNGALTVAGAMTTDLVDEAGLGSIGAYSPGTGVSYTADAMEGYISQLHVSQIARYTEAFVPDGSPEADADTLALWPMTDGEGETVAEAGSARGADGTIVGADWKTAPCAAVP